MSEVSRADAEQVLAAVRDMWPLDVTETSGPILHDHENESQDPGCWSIWWGGNCPEEWALHVKDAQFGEADKPRRERNPPDWAMSVYVEAINPYTLGLYPR